MIEQENFDLTRFNSYCLKARCKKAMFPETENEIVEVYKKNSGSPIILLGNGYNIILSKEFYDDNFLIFNGNFDKLFVHETGVVEAEAGCTMLNISLQALKHSLSGVEIFYDIPSSLGGAIVMNAGASGEEIKDVLVKVRYLDLADMNIKEILKEEMGFEYRNSFFQRNTDKIVLKAWLQLRKGNDGAIKSKMETIKAARWAKQPKEFPNGGSVFKRPPGYYVGAIMEELGLKGFGIGGAKISEKHGGFIINYNNATGQDILSLIDEVKRRVLEKYGVELEIEQRVI